jgi:hypothetical protein
VAVDPAGVRAAAEQLGDVVPWQALGNGAQRMEALNHAAGAAGISVRETAIKVWTEPGREPEGKRHERDLLPRVEGWGSPPIGRPSLSGLVQSIFTQHAHESFSERLYKGARQRHVESLTHEDTDLLSVKNRGDLSLRVAQGLLLQTCLYEVCIRNGAFAPPSPPPDRRGRQGTTVTH